MLSLTLGVSHTLGVTLPPEVPPTRTASCFGTHSAAASHVPGPSTRALSRAHIPHAAALAGAAWSLTHRTRPCPANATRPPEARYLAVARRSRMLGWVSLQPLPPRLLRPRPRHVTCGGSR